MNRVFKSAFYLTTALSLGVTVPATGWAQDNTATAGPQEMEQIVVTATRREERLQDVPISITVFNQQQLSNHNVFSTQDLAAYTPSLSVANNFGSNNSAFAIRGFVQDIGTQPTVGVFFADVVAPRGPSQGTVAGDGAGPGDFFDLQNVQVLKGPQGTLFGRNTTGGDVLLVPQKPTDEFGGYVQGSYGNFNMLEGQGVINIPVNDHIRLRFGIDHMSRDGYVDNTSGIGPAHYNDVNYTALRASADIDVTSNLENYTIATYSASDTVGDLQKMVACDAAAPLTNPGAGLFIGLGGACGQLVNNPSLRSYVSNFPGVGSSPPFIGAAAYQAPYQGSSFYDGAAQLADAYDHLRQWRVINTTTWHASDNLTVKNIASYAEVNQKLQSPLFGTNMYAPYWAGGAVPFAFAEETLVPGIPTTNEATYTEELQLQGNQWDNRLIWQAGLYLEGSDPLSVVGYQTPTSVYCTNVLTYQCEDVLAEDATFSPQNTSGLYTGPIGAVGTTFGKTSYSDYAAYGQATYKLTDEFKVTGGIRYTEDRQTNWSSQTNTNFEAVGAPYLPGSTPQLPPYYVPVPACTFPGPGTSPVSTVVTTAALSTSCIRHFLEHSHAPTWLLDVDYTPDSDTLVYAKYSRGYRSGLIVQNIPANLALVRPEKVDAYEAGLKKTFEGGPVTGTLSADGFYNDLADQQLLLGFGANPCVGYSPPYPTTGCVAATVPPTAAPINAGTSHIWGGELEATIIPYEGVTLDLAYTYMQTRLVSVRAITIPNTSPYVETGGINKNDPLELSPKNKVTVTPSYTLPLDERIGKITLSATFTHTDKQLTNYEDRTYPTEYFGAGLPINSLSFIPATDLLDLNLNWNEVAGQPVDLSVFATNVTGLKYNTWYPGIATLTGLETAEVGPPAFYGFRVKIHFGQD